MSSRASLRHTTLVAADRTDSLLRRLGVGRGDAAVARDRGDVRVLLFHKFGGAPGERGRGGAVNGPVSVRDFEAVLAFFSARGYRFLLPRDLLRDAHLGGRSVIVTVDDGYASFLRILPALERWNAPAALFVSAANVLHRTPFWSDVLVRGAAARGWSTGATRALLHELLDAPHDVAQARLAALFGADEAARVDPEDRPLTGDELREIAARPDVEIGNHAFHHVTLARRPEAYVRAELERSQAALAEMTGARPTAIAYPNGRYTAELGALCRAYGFRTGFLSRPGHRVLGPAARWGSVVDLPRTEIRAELDPVSQAQAVAMPISAQRAAVALRSRLAGARGRLRAATRARGAAAEG
jgi:peptidoglycan/xylan/chitin deacetylase (PgdA/CDA1 family)